MDRQYEREKHDEEERACGKGEHQRYEQAQGKRRRTIWYTIVGVVLVVSVVIIWAMMFLGAEVAIER